MQLLPGAWMLPALGTLGAPGGRPSGDLRRQVDSSGPWVRTSPMGARIPEAVTGELILKTVSQTDVSPALPCHVGPVPTPKPGDVGVPASPIGKRTEQGRSRGRAGLVSQPCLPGYSWQVPFPTPAGLSACSPSTDGSDSRKCHAKSLGSQGAWGDERSMRGGAGDSAPESELPP